MYNWEIENNLGDGEEKLEKGQKRFPKLENNF
jgi:hypothetical protein